MRRKMALVLAVLMALGMMAGPAMAGAAERATGSLEDDTRSFDFNAHGEVAMNNGNVREAKGAATLFNKNTAASWSMGVAAATVHDNRACFIGPITGGNAVDDDKWMRVVVIDNGPGPTDPDLVYTQQTDARDDEAKAEAEAWLEAQQDSCSTTGIGLRVGPDEAEGNLTVH